MTLLELLELLRKKWYLVVILPLVFAGATAAYCWGFMTNNYTASVSLYVLTQSSSSANGQTQVTSSDTQASQQLANDLAKIAKTSTVVDSTAKALGMQNLDDFTVNVSSDTTSRVITLTVTGKNPDAAARVANELADRATAPDTPSGPNRTMYMLVALLAGLFAAIAIIVLLDMLDNTVKSGEDAEELLGLPVLSRMPEINGKGK